MRTTKILATLGPTSDSPEVIRELIEAGVDVFRLNASHGVQEDHARRVRIVRQLAEEMNRFVGILLDLQGPKIRLGTFQNGGCTLTTGSKFVITTEQVEGDCSRASTTYKEFAKDVKADDRVLL